MDTIGSLIDKLFTIDMKLWNNQELLFKVRKMTFEEFKEEFGTKEEDMYKLWECLKKTCDLNVQRNAIMDEIDETMVKMIEQKEELDNGKFIQRKFKTY